MTNGEKMLNVFCDSKALELGGNVSFRDGDWAIMFPDEWWHTEYKEPTTKNDLGVDCISRTSALDSINWAYNLSDAYQKINDLPSVTPQLSSELEKNSKKLEKDFGESDCISRQAVLDLIADYDLSMGQVVRGIHALPSVTPQPRKGHWIRVDKDKLRCSECDVIHFIAQYPQGKIAWCPNCGADMREVEE